MSQYVYIHHHIKRQSVLKTSAMAMKVIILAKVSIRSDIYFAEVKYTLYILCLLAGLQQLTNNSLARSLWPSAIQANSQHNPKCVPIALEQFHTII